MNNTRLRPSSALLWLARLFGLVLILLGAALIVGGVVLIANGGSFYYLLAGLGLVFSGLLYIRTRMAAAGLYLLVFLLTVLWSLWEAGLDFWPLFARLFAPGILALLALLLVPALTVDPKRRRMGLVGAAVCALGAVVSVGFAFQPHNVIRAAGEATLREVDHDGQEWRSYGRTGAADRFIASDQINKQNVDQLELAWTVRTGTPAELGPVDSNTPIQVGDTLYYCSPLNKIIAINGDTGEERWTFEGDGQERRWPRCRAVAYYDATATAATSTATTATDATGLEAASDAACARRIVMTTTDARLIEVDAATGEQCEQFADGGQLDLWTGMGERRDGYYYHTSQPTVTHGLIILGGYVIDNRTVGEPSGVIRAFNADTGELVWAWDLGNPANTGAAPPEGYTPGTPNVWSAMAVDEERGLVYLPTGNATPDYWGGERSEATDTYSSSVVALDVATGRDVWHYQIVHHDLWDYDLASQPTLYDWPDGNGGRIPALIQMTKHGMIFVLNRETGEPLVEVQERPVPTGQAEGEKYAPTQPYAVGMPMIGSETLTEADMWGATPIDQMLCRIAFRQSDYQGRFTPPNPDRPILEWPGAYGGMNWGGMTVDATRDYMIFNDIRVAHRVSMIPREIADQHATVGGDAAFAPQFGTPYGIAKPNFMSVLGVPCQEPPYGTMTAIDLRTQQIAWQVPMGTTQDTGPLGIATGLQIPVGLPTLSGPVSTGGGVTFFAGTQDFYLRALDSDTGKELWKYRMPVGNNATPMIYVSPASGEQFVVVVAGGSRESKKVGDYIFAFKLPS